MSSSRRLQKTRAEILDAAWDLVSVKGAEVSLQEIARAAGISRQSVYDHFGSRGGLLMALVRRADDRFDIKNGLFSAFARADPLERLDTSIDVWVDFVERIFPVATDLIRLRATDPDASAAWEDRMADLRSWLVVLTESLEKDRALGAGWTAQAAAEYLWAAFSVQMWGMLTKECGWTADQARAVLRRTIRAALFSGSVATY
ncbi:MAG: TetR/AcrR family transcriptional regulator [Pseudomonadota bacterium]